MRNLTRSGRVKVLSQLLKKPSSAIVDETPVSCPACDSRHLHRIPRVRIDNLLGRSARYECRTCGVTSLVVEQTREKTHQPSPLASNEAAHQQSDRAEKLFVLGCKYAAVIGAAKKEKAALVCYLEAAKLGHTEAQYAAGLRLLNGIGTGRNVRLAHHWLSAAAKSGHRKAQLMVPEVETTLAGLPKWKPRHDRANSMA